MNTILMKTACAALFLCISSQFAQAKDENLVKQEVNTVKQFAHPDRIRYD